MSSDTINKILIKKNTNSGCIPSISSLDLGELGINTADGRLFLVSVLSGLSSIKTFLNSDDQYFVFNKELSAVKTQFGNNTVTQVFAGVLGGYNNDISGGGSTVINGENNDIAGDFSIIGSGLDNKITIDGDYSFIAGGQDNNINHSNVFVLGSGLSSHASNFTYVNNLSATGKIYGDGSFLTNISVGDNEATTLVKNNSANWQSAYAYVSAASINLTVAGTVSAKYFKGTLVDWMTLVKGYKIPPTLLTTLGTGEVFTYVYATSGSDITYYRYVASNGSEDSFYGNFINSTLSNLIATRAIIL